MTDPEPVVTLAEVTADSWRDIADLAPRDDQREFVAATAARYLLLGVYGRTWHNLGAYEGDTPVAHVMWATDEDGSRWVGGLLVDAAHQGRGVGRAVMAELVSRLRAAGDEPIRLSHHPDNEVSRALFDSLGFRPTGAVAGGEVVMELAGT
jgi:diamine N-acetyltransferase